MTLVTVMCNVNTNPWSLWKIKICYCFELIYSLILKLVLTLIDSNYEECFAPGHFLDVFCYVTDIFFCYNRLTDYEISQSWFERLTLLPLITKFINMPIVCQTEWPFIIFLSTVAAWELHCIGSIPVPEIWSPLLYSSSAYNLFIEDWNVPTSNIERCVIACSKNIYEHMTDSCL